MPITRTETNVVLTKTGSVTVTSTTTATLIITPNPLITVWEPPSYCTQSYLSNCQTNAVSGTLPCFVLLYPEGVCDPTGQSCYPAVPGLLGNTYLYSPGLACPTGWTTASQGVLSPSGGRDDETTAHCCPEGLQVTTYGTYSTWCEGTLTAGSDATMLVNGLSQCPSSTTAFPFGPNTPVDLTWLNVDSTQVSVSGEAVFTISAQQVVLLYKYSDLASASATPSGSSSLASSSGGGGGGVNTGLSVGATAGIGIAAAALGISAVLGAFWLFLRHRQGRGIMRRRRDGGAEGRPAGVEGIASANLAPHTRRAAIVGTAPRSQHELKGSDLNLAQSSPASWPPAGVVEMQGTAPVYSDHAWSGLPPESMGGHRQAGNETRSVHEVLGESHDYHQLPDGSGLAHRDESRQNTPLEMIGPGVGGRRF